MSPTERVKISLSYSIATFSKLTCPKSALLDGKMTDESFLDIKKVSMNIKLHIFSNYGDDHIFYSKTQEQMSPVKKQINVVHA